MMNLPEMLQQARRVQEQMQRQLQDLRVEATAGGGMVQVQMNGQKQVLSLVIDPQAFKDGDTEMLQDLIMGAINQASRRVDDAMSQKVGSLLGGLGGGLPGMDLPPGSA